MSNGALFLSYPIISSVFSQKAKLTENGIACASGKMF
uniref:Uncharacterized protein n=1 Tax=Arundo donax TaxID=35708 RepID=A0A0A9BB68_ARUDO